MFEVPPPLENQGNDDIDPATLYTPEGEVDFDAVRMYLESLPLTPEETDGSPLDSLTMPGGTYSLNLPYDIFKSDPNAQVIPQSERPKTLDHAIGVFMARLILQDIHINTQLPANPLLQNDHTAKLNFSDESAHFLDTIGKWQKSGMNFIRTAYEFMGESQNDVNELDCVVAIPVAGHQEYENIFHTLEQFTNQSLPPNKFEVDLYLNLPGREGEQDRALADSLNLTLGEIERFKSQYPEIAVRYFANVYRGDPPVIGEIRADLWNTIVYDMAERERKDDILVISSDADIDRLNKDYLSSMVTTFKDNDADVVTAKLLWQRAPGLDYNSLTNRILRYQSFLDHVRDRHDDMLHTADANTGISLAMYMAVGGYDRSKKLGEMNNIIDRIRYYRQSPDQKEADKYTRPDPPIELKAPDATLRTNSRRLIKAMALGASPYHAWDQRLIQFGTDDSLRTEEMQSEAAEQAAQVHAKKWISEMTGGYVGNVPPKKKRRILRAAHHIFRFSELS